MIALAALLAAAAAATPPARAASCVGCHGDAARAKAPTIPPIAGQQREYLSIQLVQYRDARRQDPRMTPFARGLTDAEIEELAAWFAAEPPPAPERAGAPAARVEAGRRVSEANHCGSCHLPDYRGQRHVPRLAGLGPAYLLAQMRAFKAQRRADLDGSMTMAAQPLSDRDIEDVVAWIARDSAEPAGGGGFPPSPEPLGGALEGLAPPLPVSTFGTTVEGHDVRLAYVDLAPAAAPNGRTALLLHGKNFWCDYWEGTARRLAARGFRVVVPDQLGFGRSSKPPIHYSFERLAALTRALLDRLGVKQVAVVGHSMGGMLAVRFALMYPGAVTQLVLEDPIGLEDYREKVPYRTIEEWTRAGLGQGREQVLRFYQAYFARWSDAYERWPDAAFRMQSGPDAQRVALASALTYDMIYTQPVVHDLPRLRLPTLLVVGRADRTAVGKALVPKEVAATMGDVPALARRAAQAIPGARLVEIPDAGHIPHLEAPDAFHAALLEFLR